jgi:Vps52 / Sac2 family
VLLWPRFKLVFDANVRSVRDAHPRRLGSVDLTPHYVTRRYAEFAASLLALHSGCATLKRYPPTILRTKAYCSVA